MKNRNFLFWIALVYVASALDAHSTLLSLAAGNSEANPFVLPFLGNTQEFVAYRAFLVPSLVSLVAYLLRRAVRKISYFLAVPVSVWLLASFSNYLKA